MNSDKWIEEKRKIFSSIFRKKDYFRVSFVDEVIDFKDDDEGSCKNALKKIKKKYPKDKIIFCNGGDRNKSNIPEQEISEIEFKFSVGGDDKKNSSSEILKNWTFLREKRLWGEFFELYSNKNLKVKELIILPNQGMSFQRHHHRNEIWFISEGSCEVNHSESMRVRKKTLSKEDTFMLKKRMASNNKLKKFAKLLKYNMEKL